MIRAFGAILQKKCQNTILLPTFYLRLIFEILYFEILNKFKFEINHIFKIQTLYFKLDVKNQVQILCLCEYWFGTFICRFGPKWKLIWDYATFISSWQPFSRICIRFFLIKSQKMSKSQFFLPSVLQKTKFYATFYVKRVESNR